MTEKKKKRIRVWTVWIHSVRYGFDRRVRSNFYTRDAAQTFMWAQPERTRSRMYMYSEWKTQRQVSAQRAMARKMRAR